MIPTTAHQRQIDAKNEARDQIVAKALENARFHERQIREDSPHVDHRYHAGAIDAYVAILKSIDPHTDWLAHIRATA